MAIIGYHASHEQFRPTELLRYVQAAEKAGFDAAMCSDHFHPWMPGQGNSAFAWSWLGAALQATQLSFGTVNAPGYRYHPAIVAQAAATLASMYPGRFWLAVGTGEALNEAITGHRWPPKDERRERLVECVEIMRRLWAGETVTHRGRVTVEQATLHTLADQPPKVLAAAITTETARWAGGWADGVITVGHPPNEAAGLIEAFAEGGGGGVGKVLAIQLQIAWADTDEEAARLARQRWPIGILGSDVLAELRLPEHFAAATRTADQADVAEHMLASSSVDFYVERLSQYTALGFDRLYLHHVGPDQERFIEKFAADVLPPVRSSAATVA